MKKARILRRELDLWKIAWQQIEAFLERIEGARDQDEPYAKRCHALLTAVRVIEHQQAFFFDDRPLSDPVIDRLPESWYKVDEEQVQPIAALNAWGKEFRIWRIPGSDELELAVGNLYIDDDGHLEEKVCLRGGIDLKLEQRVEEEDPRFAGSERGLVPVRLPSYPGLEADHPIVEPGAVWKVDITSETSDGKETASLFSKQRRERSTLGRLGEDEEATLTWSEVCAARRGCRRESVDNEVRYVGVSAELPWSGSRAADGWSAVEQIRSGITSSGNAGTLNQKLAAVAAAAAASSDWLACDSQDLRGAADSLDEEGSEDPSLPGAIRGAGEELASQHAGFEAVAAAAGALLNLFALPGPDPAAGAAISVLRRERADALAAALTTLGELEPRHPLLRAPPENSALAAELDTVIAARLAYPDGSLRLLRALEWMFLDVWPARRRWLRHRYRRALGPLLRGFRRPFVDGLRALIRGGDTGLPCVGLELSTGIPVGGESLPTTHPASIRDAVRDIETGHVAIIGGDRPAAAVILGLGKEAGKLTINTAPLRVSVATEGPGSAGMVTAGVTLECEAAGLSTEELRLGESARGPAVDGVVQEAVALWSRLALVFGWLGIEQELQDDAGLVETDYERRLIPEPSGRPLHQVRLHGRIEPNTLGLAIRGLGAAFWEREPQAAPLPLVARPGELLLLRGRAEAGEEGGAGPLVQVVVEVESVYGTTGALLERMDPGQMAQLSTQPLSEEEQQACRLLCRPEEDIAMVVLRRTWLTEQTLVDSIYLGRDFPGFDDPSLATETLLPAELVGVITGTTPDDGGYDRFGEYAAAQQQLATWTRYAR